MFSIHATDGGQLGPRSNAVDVTIHIDDVNDNSPVFTHVPYSASISQSASIGTEILTVSVYHRDCIFCDLISIYKVDCTMPDRILLQKS